MALVAVLATNNRSGTTRMRSAAVAVLMPLYWAIPLNRNTPPTEDHKLSPGGSQRINYSFVPGGYKICHCPREVAAVRHCPGGVRAFYNTLGLYKFPVQGRGLS